MYLCRYHASYLFEFKNEMKQKISEVNNIKELGELYHSNPELSRTLDQEFITKKNLLLELTNKI